MRYVNNRSVVRLGAAGAAFAMVGLAAAPALAADSVAKASATAVRLDVAGMNAYSGTYAVDNDGTTQTSSGNNKPLVAALTGQSLLSVGTLAQDATTSVTDGRGSSAACSGIAGQGATLAAVGSGNCLTPGQSLALNAGNLKLTSLTLVETQLTSQIPDSLQPVVDAINAASSTALPAVEAQLQAGLTQALAAIGNPALNLNIGAVQSTCTADTGSAQGDATLTNVNAALQLPQQAGGQRVQLASFDVHPAPNTKVLTNLNGLVTALQGAIDDQLTVTATPDNAVTTALTALTATTPSITGTFDDVVDAIKAQAISQIQSQLAPLEANILDGTLNEQSGTADSIDVTAVDLKILPAARAFGFDSVVRLQLANSTCGPNGERVVSAPAAAPPAAPQVSAPTVPTEVRSGLAHGDDQGLGLVGMGALGGLMVVGVGAGLAVQRRRLEALKVPVQRHPDGS